MRANKKAYVMTQVHKEFLRIIVVKAKHDGVPACEKECPELRRLNYCSLVRLRESCAQMLKELPEHRYRAILNEARTWYMALSTAEYERYFAEYDNLPDTVPQPYRIDWSQHVPHRHPGDLLDKRV